MADRILTFLGTGELYATTYTFSGRGPVVTRYLAEALAAFYPCFEVTVFVTEKALNAYGSDLRSALTRHGCFLTYVSVPELTDPAEMWTVFSKVAETVGDGDRVVFDITHSYRSLPMLVLLALSYLRVVRSFELVALLYAPYIDYTASPVHDLRPFLDLLDWTTATHLFLTTGNADELSDQLAKDSGLDLGFEPETLSNAATALRLHRPDEARALAWKMVQALRAVDDRAGALGPEMRPFGTLAKRLQESLEAVTPEEPDPDDLRQELRQELAMVHWNANQGQWAAAVTLAREWLVSLVCWHAGWVPDDNGTQGWREKRGRDKAEKALNRLAEEIAIDRAEGEGQAAAELAKHAGSLPDAAKAVVSCGEAYACALARTWHFVHTLRNDLNHAGKVVSTNTRTASDLLCEAKAVPGRLDVVYALSGLGPQHG